MLHIDITQCYKRFNATKAKTIWISLWDSSPSFSTVKKWAAEFIFCHLSICENEHSGCWKPTATDKNMLKNPQCHVKWSCQHLKRLYTQQITQTFAYEKASSVIGSAFANNQSETHMNKCFWRVLGHILKQFRLVGPYKTWFHDCAPGTKQQFREWLEVLQRR